MTFGNMTSSSSQVLHAVRISGRTVKGSKAIWNILSEYGKRVLVMNVPITYPPETKSMAS
jgi:predicted AlkP superfamily phosphohydrolase/phosphomutase